MLQLLQRPDREITLQLKHMQYTIRVKKLEVKINFKGSRDHNKYIASKETHS